MKFSSEPYSALFSTGHRESFAMHRESFGVHRTIFVAIPYISCFCTVRFSVLRERSGPVTLCFYSIDLDLTSDLVLNQYLFSIFIKVPSLSRRCFFWKNRTVKIPRCRPTSLQYLGCTCEIKEARALFAKGHASLVHGVNAWWIGTSCSSPSTPMQ